jgi:hypothetical protein
MSLPTRTSLALALALAVSALAAASSGASSPAVHAAKSCHLSNSAIKHLGADYTTKLHTHATGCVTGKRVAKKFNVCRRHHGASRCRPFSYHCKESHVARSSAQRSAQVKCTKAGKVVIFAYTTST